MVNIMKNYKIFFHSADLDGYSSAMLCYNYLKDISNYIQLIPYNYSKKLDLYKIKKTDNIYLVDLTFKPNEMIYLKQLLKHNFIWIDHHISSINDSIEHNYNQILGLRDINYAGCELTWKYLYNNEPCSKVIRLLGRYDVWDYEDKLNLKDHDPKNVLPFQYGMRLNPTFPSLKNSSSINFWLQLLKSDDISSIINNGKIINQYNTQQWNISSKLNTWLVNFEGLNLLTTCTPGITSLFYDSQFTDDHDAAANLCIIKDKYSVSLYGNPKSKTNPDLSIIAKKYGGGGHHSACGYSCTLDHIIQTFYK